MYKSVENLPNIKYTDKDNFFLMAGPCVIEDENMAYPIAKEIQRITDKLEIPFIFKASYRKANRSKMDSFSGIGDEKALNILRDISRELEIPVVTDIHSPEEAEMASVYVDVLQIPAFLCRQTELLIAAGKTGKVVNIKKGQFVSGDSMKFAAEKVRSTGNENVWLTERGSMFGYGDLVVDYRNIPAMQKAGVPVVLDITHSLQQPNQSEGVTGGKPDLIETIGRAGVAVGVDGIFLETHPNPAVAKSDGANMLRLDLLENLLTHLVALRQTINRF
ncbi:MAG: 3-deoxy-8-phosphooctulonate synthase [Bacteroidales bacterium]|nr:3-deoxy-8-phosphooctulonate synthase [Bacteroidales bacterium]